MIDDEEDEEGFEFGPLVSSVLEPEVGFLRVIFSH